MEDTKEDAKTDLQQERQAWEKTDHASKQEIAELLGQIKDLGSYVQGGDTT